MGLLSGILGGGGGGTESVSTLTKQQKPIAGALGDWLLPLIGQGAAGWGGDFVAPIGQLEQQSLGLAGQAMQGMQNPMYAQALQSILGGATSSGAESNFMQNVFPALQRLFQEQIQPEITEAYVGPGLVDSGRRTEGEAWGAQRFGEFAGTQLANMIQMDRQLAAGALPMGLAAQMQPMQMAAMGQQVGALPRMLQQQEINAKLQEFLRTQPEMSPVIQQALAFLNTPMMGMYGVGGGGMGSAIGGGMGGALAGAQIGSAVPGIGTLIGAGLGGGAGFLGGLF